MAPLTLTVPNEYGYVLGALASSLMLTPFHMFWVGSYRRAAGIKYPNAYAPTTVRPSPSDKLSSSELKQKEAEYAFNCAVRAHAQYTEHISTFIPALLIAGLKWPVASSVLGMLWVVNRLAFSFGYAKSQKANGVGRFYGAAYLIFELILIGMSGKVAWDAVFN